ncbi:MAG: DUF86 domain-containing protein [Candidatus Poribacteria bacterium]
MKRDDLIRLKHMLESAYYARKFIVGRKRSDLDNDRMLLNSLVRELEIIGEAASRISEETKIYIPTIPWKIIINMRNHLIHAYHDLNLDIIWDTIEINLPELIYELEKIPKLREEFNKDIANDIK